jgi:hypothetical protein
MADLRGLEKVARLDKMTGSNKVALTDQRKDFLMDLQLDTS